MVKLRLSHIPPPSLPLLSFPFPLYPFPPPSSSSLPPHLELVAHCDVPPIIQHLHKWQGVPLPALVIVAIVGWGDLDRSRPKAHVHHLIRNNHQLTIAERVLALLANQILEKGESFFLVYPLNLLASHSNSAR